MAPQETYKNAPAVEAVLDVRVRLSSPLTPESLKALHESEIDAYPGVRTPYNVQFKIEPGKPQPETTYQATGQVFASKDGLQLFQCRQDGFSHNRLAPYTAWETFRAEARRLWNRYREIAKPVHVEMLGLNFINRIFARGGSEVKDYFNIYVEIPKAFDGVLDVHNFLVQTNQPDSQAKVAVSSSLGAIDASGMIPVLLNIQSFIFPNKGMSEISEEEIWDQFEKLRDLKNVVFEACITDKARETFR